MQSSSAMFFRAHCIGMVASLKIYVLAGPIYVCDAEPGDVLQVEILDVQPRYTHARGVNIQRAPHS